MKTKRLVLVTILLVTLLLAACGPNKVNEAPKRVARLTELCVASEGGGSTVPVLAQIKVERDGYASKWDAVRNRQSRQVAALSYSSLASVNDWCGRLGQLKNNLSLAGDMTDKKAKEAALTAIYDSANEAVVSLEGLVGEPRGQYNAASSALSSVNSAELRYSSVQGEVIRAPSNAHDKAQASRDLDTARRHIDSAWNSMASGSWGGVESEVFLAGVSLDDAEENAEPPTPTPEPTHTPEPYVPPPTDSPSLFDWGEEATPEPDGDIWGEDNDEATPEPSDIWGDSEEATPEPIDPFGGD